MSGAGLSVHGKPIVYTVLFLALKVVNRRPYVKIDEDSAALFQILETLKYIKPERQDPRSLGATNGAAISGNQHLRGIVDRPGISPRLNSQSTSPGIGIEEGNEMQNFSRSQVPRIITS